MSLIEMKATGLFSFVCFLTCPDRSKMGISSGAILQSSLVTNVTAAPDRLEYTRISVTRQRMQRHEKQELVWKNTRKLSAIVELQYIYLSQTKVQVKYGQTSMGNPNMVSEPVK